MVAVKTTRGVEVYHHRGEAMSIKEIEEFCKKAREAGFKPSDKPWVGGGLCVSMQISRSEPIHS